jgi:hypothetical protein
MLESVGTLEGSLGGQPIHLTGPLGRKRVVVTPKGKGWIPFRIKYQGPSQNFTLALYRLEGEGWRILGAQEYHP